MVAARSGHRCCPFRGGQGQLNLDIDRPSNGAAIGLAVASPSDLAAEVAPHLAKMAALAGQLADGADRDDVVQEALTRAWVKRAQFDPTRGTLSAWLLAIIADQARKAGRRRVRRLLPLAAPASPPTANDRVDVLSALGHLSARQRTAVDCYYFAGLSVLETAAVMGCSEGTVKSTLADARKALRPWLETRP